MGSAREIVYFVPCDPRQGMGGGARVDQMLVALERMGFSVNVVAYSGYGRLVLNRTALSDRTRMFEMSVPAQIPKVLKSMALPLLFLVGLVRAKRESVVIAHSPGIASGFLGLIVSIIKHGHLVVDFTDLRDNDTPDWVHRRVLSSACIVFAVSRRLESEARLVGAPNVIHLPTFLDLTRYPKQIPGREELRQSLGIGRDAKVVGYFGSFSKGEGLGILLEVFADIAEDLPDVRLLVVGARNVTGAEDVDRIIKELQIQEEVILLPPQPYSRMPALMRAVDLLVAPKIAGRENEVCDPTKVYEYLACGIPCIMSEISEIAVIARDRQAAIVVEPGNRQALLGAVKWVLANPEAAKRLATRGRELIETSFSVEKGGQAVRQALTGHGIPVLPVRDGDPFDHLDGDEDEPQL